MIYFLQIEVLFDQHYITGSVLQYRWLVLALSLEVVTPNHCFLQTITAATPNPYELLMTRLLQTSAPTDTALLSQLLAAVELGDWRPTDMMNTMLSQLPPDEPAGKLFLALYLQWLPASLRLFCGTPSLLWNSWWILDPASVCCLTIYQKFLLVLFSAPPMA